jgi:predicted Zn-dependent protease
MEAKANLAYREGRLDEARELLERIIQLDPRSAGARALLGLTFARQNDLRHALVNLQRACEIDPNNPDFAYDYSVLLVQARQYRTAIPILETLHRRSPQANDILVNLARAYAATANSRKLSALIQTLSVADYGNQALLESLATILAGAGQTSAIATLWESAIRDDPNQSLPYAALAEFWIARGDASRALAVLNEAPAATRDPLYLYATGETRMALKDYQEAIRIFQDLTRRLPQNPKPWQQWIRCNMLAGHLNEAERVADQAARSFPDAMEFPYQQAVVDYMLGRTHAAIQVLTPVVDQEQENDPRPILLMAVLNSQGGNYRDAKHYFERAKKMEPGCNALASYFYGITLLRMDRPLEAQNQLQDAIHCHPRFGLAEYRLGQALSEEGKLPLAVAELEQATRDNPALAEPYYLLAQLRRRLGNPVGAREALARFGAMQKHVAASDRELLGYGLHHQTGNKP